LPDDYKPVKLFAKQKAIYPKRVWGKYRKIKWIVMFVTLAIYYLAPWLRWDRGVGAPDQAILIDLPNSRAYFFSIEIWPQEIYYLTGLLIIAAVALFFVTSLFGRIWCGYACPQTVWTDLFVWVERVFQGDRNARIKLDKSPLSFEKIWKKAATHFTWLFIGLCTGGAWVFYFNDAPTLAEHMLHFDVPWSVMVWVVSLTISTYIMAGFARDQVCAFMCPYARFQSAMFDKDSLIIGYDEERGETRGSHKKGESWEGRGHCVDCTACVQVCPMGIDIRDGLQMECIACGFCIDACNNIMDKVGLPHGLVRYDTTNNQEARLAGKPEKSRIFRLRTFYYGGILLVVGSLMLYSLMTRSPLDLSVLHDRNPLFVKMSDGKIRNGYEVKILNKTHDDRNYTLEILDFPDAEIEIKGAGNLTFDNLPVLADSVGHFRVFIKAKAQKKNRKEIMLKIQDKETLRVETEKTIFVSKNK